MLSSECRAIVRSTVPLLERDGEALTRRFYEILLGDYPQLHPLFNQANQQSGEQQRALANGILMYARHIDELDKLGDLVELIVNKHISLQVQAEHYDIVGACLLRAIRDVLGADTANDSVIDAWGEAYRQLARILSEAESQRYQRLAARPGGWLGGRMFDVARKVVESDEITSFYLVPSDAGPILAHASGQYIGLRVNVGDKEHRRNYSLSAAANGLHYRISVKREPGGIVSGHLHAHVHEGHGLELFPPSGHFTLEESDRPLVLISAGVGITPTLAMLETALPSGRTIHFIHAARNHRVHAFREFIDDLERSHKQVHRYYCYEEQSPAGAPSANAVGRLDLHLLQRWMPTTRDVDAYFLGPAPFMRAVKRHLGALGVPGPQCRHEFFGPASAL